MQAAELSQAMATGVVESYMSIGSTGYDTKTYEHLKYWYDTQAWLPKNAVHRQQGGLRRARRADQGGRAEGRPPTPRRAAGRRARRDNTEYLDKLKANGMNIVAAAARSSRPT